MSLFSFIYDLWHSEAVEKKAAAEWITVSIFWPGDVQHIYSDKGWLS